jgi:hypothetical protein
MFNSPADDGLRTAAIPLLFKSLITDSAMLVDGVAIKR